MITMMTAWLVLAPAQVAGDANVYFGTRIYEPLYVPAEIRSGEVKQAGVWTREFEADMNFLRDLRAAGIDVEHLAPVPDGELDDVTFDPAHSQLRSALRISTVWQDWARSDSLYGNTLAFAMLSQVAGVSGAVLNSGGRCAQSDWRPEFLTPRDPQRGFYRLGARRYSWADRTVSCRGEGNLRLHVYVRALARDHMNDVGLWERSTVRVDVWFYQHNRESGEVELMSPTQAMGRFSFLSGVDETLQAHFDQRILFAHLAASRFGITDLLLQEESSHLVRFFADWRQYAERVQRQREFDARAAEAQADYDAAERARLEANASRYPQPPEDNTPSESTDPEPVTVETGVNLEAGINVSMDGSVDAEASAEAEASVDAEAETEASAETEAADESEDEDSE